MELEGGGGETEIVGGTAEDDVGVAMVDVHGCSDIMFGGMSNLLTLGLYKGSTQWYGIGPYIVLHNDDVESEAIVSDGHDVGRLDDVVDDDAADWF